MGNYVTKDMMIDKISYQVLSTAPDCLGLSAIFGKTFLPNFNKHSTSVRIHTTTIMVKTKRNDILGTTFRITKTMTSKSI